MFAGFALAGVFTVVGGSAANAAIVPTVPLLTSANYSVLGASTVTNTGNSTLGLSLGLWPGTSITGFPPGQVLAPGTTDQGNPAAHQAKSDLTAAYLNAAGRAIDATTTADLANLTLQPGVYAGPSKGALGLTGPLTLDAGGDPTAVFIFQTDSTLITASSSTVSLINGAQECNVFWQVGSSATLGTGSVFVGNILALTSITVTNSVTVHGRALARNAAVTLDNDTFTTPTCETRLDSVSVTKTVRPASLPNWSVDFTISPDPSDGSATKTATKGQPTVSWGKLNPTTLYTITETTPSGWTEGVMTCAKATVDKGPARLAHTPEEVVLGQASFTSGGGVVSCAVQDLAPPMVTITKTVVGSGPWSFDFTISPVPNGQPATQSATNLVPIVVWTGLDPAATYTVTEGGDNNYSPGPLVCSGDTGTQPDLIQVVAASDTFAPAMGDGVTCSVTNTEVQLPPTGSDPFLFVELGLALVGLGAISQRLARRRNAVS